MELQEYKNLLKDLPRPTADVTDYFINRVARDHSWYKHLPNERLVRFVFYLDPNAGKTLEKVVSTENSKDEKRFIFKEKDKNGSNYGYAGWQYFTKQYTVNFIPNSDGSFQDSRPFIGLNIIDAQGTAVPLPELVIRKGTFLMSRYLHRVFENDFEFIDQDGISNGEKHSCIINDLRDHLNSFYNFIYDEI